MADAKGNVGSTRFALELEGEFGGWVPKVTSGGAHADLVAWAGGEKNIGTVRFEDLVLSCGPGMSNAFYSWVADACNNMARGTRRMDGAILTCDAQNKVLSRLEWNGGSISAIGFPPLDVESKNPAALTVKVSPRFTRTLSGDGTAVRSIFSRPRPWLGSAFRLEIDGLEVACKRVARIRAITISHDVRNVVVGSFFRDYQNEPDGICLPNVVIVFTESSAHEFYEWFHDFVILGKNSASREKNGSLEFLTPNMGSTLFSLQFNHLGIDQITPASNLRGSDIRKVIVKMHWKGIRLGVPGVTT